MMLTCKDLLTQIIVANGNQCLIAMFEELKSFKPARVRICRGKSCRMDVPTFGKVVQQTHFHLGKKVIPSKLARRQTVTAPTSTQSAKRRYQTRT